MAVKKRKPYNKSTGRQYGEGSYDKAYQARPKQRRNRSVRNSSRRIAEKKLGASAIKGKDIGHKELLSKTKKDPRKVGFTVQSIKYNRGKDNKKIAQMNKRKRAKK